MRSFFVVATALLVVASLFSQPAHAGGYGNVGVQVFAVPHQQTFVKPFAVHPGFGAQGVFVAAPHPNRVFVQAVPRIQVNAVPRVPTVRVQNVSLQRPAVQFQQVQRRGLFGRRSVRTVVNVR